jgi:shikimate kinase
MWTSLIGFMASGKSAVTRRLQTVASRPILSLDDAIETRTGMTVARIFAKRGEAAFRTLEQETLAAQDPARQLVVDTGGGVIQTPEAVALLRRRGVVIWLDSTWDALRARLKESDQSARPLIGRLGWAGLEELFHRRRRLYARAADFRLRSDQDSIDVLARKAMLRSLQWQRRRDEAQHEVQR